MSLPRYLQTFSEIFRRPLSADLIEAYERALSDVPELTLDAACEMAIRECRFFPNPAEIRSFCPVTDSFVPTTNKSSCKLCAGTGWKTVKRPDGDGVWAVACDCRKRKTA
jgi:hypothetical protein